MLKKNCLIIVFSLYSIGVLFSQGTDINRHITKFGQLLFYIDNYYLDSVSSDTLTEEAIKRVVSLLDPHSSYISAKDVRAMNEPLEGNFEGVGIEFMIINDTLVVSTTISGGPSERVGLRSGDRIVEIDGSNIASIGLTNQMVFGYLRGPKDSRVNLRVIRRGVNGVLDFEVIRDRIPINSVEAAYEAAPGVVYIKLSRFANNSSREIINALLNLNIRKIDGFILDLRGNSGGFLGTALEISNFFLESGQTIVYTEGTKVPTRKEIAKGTGFYRSGALAILIDENSASASEIVAGAVQDWDRGVIIGRRSFGKGLVQQMLPMADGSQLRLTVARYHTPSGRVIQSPYQTGSKEQYYRDFLDRFERGESINRDSIHFMESLLYKTMIKGRDVYGGGGIMPDIFIPADTSFYSNYYATLLRRGVILEYTNNFSDKYREALLPKFPDFIQFNQGYHISDSFMDDFISFATSKGIEFNEQEYLKSKEEILIYFKALIARSLYGNTAYFRVINSSNDRVFQAALDYIKKSSR